jgi:3,4-dihydroxy 2-butanone 4-phosphate synthase/GTP cyclohydrolase II
MIRHTSGIICAPMRPDIAERMNLSPMVATNRDPLRTAFTVSVDYRVGLTTASRRRSAPIPCALWPTIIASPPISSGPATYFLDLQDRRVLIRSGHTEAATDLARSPAWRKSGCWPRWCNDDGR